MRGIMNELLQTQISLRLLKSHDLLNQFNIYSKKLEKRDILITLI